MFTLSALGASSAPTRKRNSSPTKYFECVFLFPEMVSLPRFTRRRAVFVPRAIIQLTPCSLVVGSGLRRAPHWPMDNPPSAGRVRADQMHVKTFILYITVTLLSIKHSTAVIVLYVISQLNLLSPTLWRLPRDFRNRNVRARFHSCQRLDYKGQT